MDENKNIIDFINQKENSNTMVNEEYISKTKIFGIPLVHMCRTDVPGEKIKTAKGIIAIGNSATGVIAMGGTCIGIITFGVINIGIISIGGLSIGLIFSAGFISIGWISIGVIAIGYYAIGLLALGMECLGINSTTQYMRNLAEKFLPGFFKNTVNSKNS